MHFLILWWRNLKNNGINIVWLCYIYFKLHYLKLYYAFNYEVNIGLTYNILYMWKMLESIMLRMAKLGESGAWKSLTRSWFMW